MCVQYYSSEAYDVAQLVLEILLLIAIAWNIFEEVRVYYDAQCCLVLYCTVQCASYCAELQRTLAVLLLRASSTECLCFTRK